MLAMSRRRRLLAITAAAAVLFLGVAGLAAWRWSQPEATYTPGEQIDGITSGLERPIPADHPRVTFTDVTPRSGIRFTHFSGTRTSQLPEDMGSGAAWGDFDNDGWLDLVIANAVGPLTMSDAERAASPARTSLYRNNHDGTFSDVTDRSGIDVRALAMAVAWGDYDNDGRIDLALTSYGTNRLYRNNGDGTFSDRSVVSGIGGLEGFWAGASWGDYNRDGFLDLYVTGYVRFTQPDSAQQFTGKYDVENPAGINPSAFRPERNLLYRNERNGTFTEVAREAGVIDTAGRGLSAAWVDLDEDGWLDLYVANDVSDNVLFRNTGEGTFTDISHAARVADYRSAMGIAVGDWDGDEDQDLFLTHWVAQENALYSNQLSELRSRPAPARTSAPRLAFMDEADRHGLGQSSLDFVGWGTSFIDYDNDGRLDLFMVNGSTLQSRADSTRLVPMRNQLYWNRGPAQGFFEVSPVSGAAFRETRVGRGAAFGDYDNDGDVDVIVVNHGAAPTLLRNDGGNRNPWLAVELRGTKSNRQGIGARVRVVAGGKAQIRVVGSQSSYLSQNSLVENFGLGPATTVDTVEVLWPSGARDVRAGLTPNQRIIVPEGRGSASDRVRLQEFWRVYREATALRMARDLRRAAEAYGRALELNPGHEDALYYAGSMSLELGRFDDAAASWKRLAEVNPSSARTHSQLARLYMCLDTGAPFRPDFAERHLSQAHAINREESGPLLRLGELALLRGDLARARYHLETVLASNAASAPAHFYLGYLAWTAKDMDAARSSYDRAISSAAKRPPTAGVPGEGDTKSGITPMKHDAARCNQLDALSDAPVATPDADRGMAMRYRQLDTLIAQGRRRIR